MTGQAAPIGGRLRFVLLGAGRWGSRLAAAVGRLDGVALVGVADVEPAARQRVLSVAPGAAVHEQLADLLALRPDAVLLATPPAHHAAQAREVLDAGCHLFVEKPLATRASDAWELCSVARAAGRVAMVGHVLRFHPAYERLERFVKEGGIGRPVALSSSRLTGSRSPSALWALAPHDLATLLAIDSSEVVELQVRPAAPAPDLAPDADTARAVELELRLRSGLSARFRFSTAATTSVRRFELTGSHRRIVVDELGVDGSLWHEPLELRDADGQPPAPPRVALASPDHEPLLAELGHLADCIRSGSEPRCGLEEGARVVETIEHAETLLAARPSTPSRGRSASRPPAPRTTSRATALG